MRTFFAGILGLSSFICAAQTHEPMPQEPQRADVRPSPGHPQTGQDGGNREVLESIVIPPIPNAPFFATLATESVKYSADGGSMTFVNDVTSAVMARAASMKSVGFWCPGDRESNCP